MMYTYAYTYYKWCLSHKKVLYYILNCVCAGEHLSSHRLGSLHDPVTVV